ncbi:Retrovirus-related Pol polyprotein from transposon opus [Phytophthora citrophthora]|uniref:RNA-directed DNA polymerase n=1 Tax=Phytophthora citrophthora TaxID=4793 RepID=A0AAD9GZA5_9STRA|nr:Retrovirus-related Pol polyprotein from transposon opus [Phytophthora citrophthora]
MVFSTNEEDNNQNLVAGSPSNAGLQTPSETTNPPNSSVTPSILRAPQTIFAVVAAPLVTSTSREAPLEWLKLRNAYEEVTRERCKDGKEDYRSVLKSGMEKNQLTDEFLLEKIHAITDNYRNQALPPVNELFLNELKMNITMKTFSHDFFEGEKGAKKKCNLLVNSLPEKLKEKVRNEIDCRSPEARTSVLKLSKLINQQALEQAIEDRALKRCNGANRKVTAREQRGAQMKKRLSDGRNQQYEKRPRKGDTRRVEKPADKKDKQGTKGAPQDGCFHCGCPHYLSGCPTATKDDRERLVSKQMSGLWRGGTANLRRLAECLPTQARSLVLEDTFSVDFCADSGSDRSGISRTVWERFVKVCPEVKAVQLKEPLDCRGADGKSIEMKWIVNLHLRLGAAAGSVRITKPVEFLIIPGDADEFLLGNDMLTMLGIDVQRQLELLVAGTVQNELDDEFDDVDEPRIGSSVDLSDELLVAVEKLVEKAVEKGFPAKLAPELRRIAVQFDIWRLKLGDDPPARVPPMKVRLRDGAKPYRCKARRYPLEVRNFLDDFNNELVRLGWVYENAESRWACPVLPVRKSGGEYRQTADYKSVNADIVAIVGVMPDLHVDLEEVKGAKFFGPFDFIKGYWQLALAEECQKWLSYMTHRKVYTPRRVPQADNSEMSRRTVAPPLAGTYLSKLERLFELLDFFGFKISPKKSSLFEQEVWCSPRPERIRALQTLPYPKNAGELQQFLCATNWMRDSLVDYAQKARPLQEALDLALAKASRRTKRVAAGIAIEFSDTERSAYDQMKEMLASSATLAFPKDGATILGSRHGSSGTDTRTLICLSGSFTGSQRNWSIIEKEAYPIVRACEKLSYLLLHPGGFRLYCDHRNLIYVFAPGKEVKKHIRGKLLRWSTKLMEYRYEVEHIDGEANVWADMISRWAGNHDPTVHLSRTRCRRKKTPVDDQKLLPQLLRPLDDPDFVWPSASAIRDTQQLHADCRPQVAVGDGENGWFIKDKVWIPRKADDQVQRLLVVAHCGPQGHRGRDAMMESVGRHFKVHHLRARIEHFPRVMPHFFGRQLLTGIEGRSYAFYGARAMFCSNDRFGVAPVWISDQGSHFKAEIVGELRRRLKARHEFTVVYSPWINGSVERANLEIMQMLRVMCLEYKVDTHDWTFFVPLLHASLNHTPVPSLGNAAQWDCSAVYRYHHR